MRILSFAALLLMGQLNLAQGGVMTGTATPFTGALSEVNVTLDDMAAGLGNIQVTVSLAQNSPLGDLRGVFFHISDESLLDPQGFSIFGQSPGNSITTTQFGPANSVTSVGSNNVNMNAVGTPGPFDLGFEIGTSGIGSDDYQSVSFNLSHNLVDLDLSLFANQAFGVRVMSVVVGSERSGSSRLSGVFPDVPSTPPTDPSPGPSLDVNTVPEPGTLAIWSVLGICGFGAARRKRGGKASS